MNPLSSNYLKNVGGANKAINRQLPKQAPKVPKSTPKPNLQVAPDNYHQQILASFELEDPQTFSHLLYVKEGYMFAFTTSLKKISGRATILFPEGTVVNCNVFENAIHGWAVFYKRNLFVNICAFRRGRFEGLQFTHDIQKGIMVEAQYKNGRLHTIIRCIPEAQMSFDRFLNHKALSDLLRETQKGMFFDRYYPKIQSSLGNYYGEIIGEVPTGVGVLIASPEIFFGQFDRGLLEGFGTMVFDNGHSCFGQFEQGCPRGLGCFIRKGVQTCRYHDSLITTEQLKSYLRIKSFRQDKKIESIFEPVISFYEKLKAIYKSCAGQSSLKELSFVDIELAKEEGQSDVENSDRKSKDSSSELPTDRKEHFPDVYGQLIKNNQDPQGNTRKTEGATPPKLLTTQAEALQVESGQKKDLKQTLMKRKQGQKKKMLASDQQWDAIIEELDAEESIGFEDGFMVPKAQPFKDENNQQRNPNLKETALRTSEGRQNVVRLGKEAMYGNEKEEVKLGRIIGQLTKNK